MASLLQMKASPAVSVHFLGTCSGGGPILSRNCSSLAVDFGHDIWLIDAADGTLGRLHQSSLKMANISRIFITHMHADHVLGLVAILTTIMSGVGTTEASRERLRALGTKKKANVNIFGPAGLRQLIRMSLTLTSVTLAGAYAVHELLSPQSNPSAACGVKDLHVNEAVGMDVRADAEGVWDSFMCEGNGRVGKGWAVSAGPIEHRVPSVGYVMEEPVPRAQLDTATLIPLLQSNAMALAALDPPVKHPLSLLTHLTSLPAPPPYSLPSGEVLRPPGASGIPPRKLVIFGDCSGGTQNERFRQMCQGASLLIHECTNSAIPELIQKSDRGRKIRQRELEQSLLKRLEKLEGPTTSDSTRPAVPSGVNDDSSSGARLVREAAQRKEVRRKALSRGHSTPDEVGQFARSIQARRVVVNHFSAMFPSPRYPTSETFPSLLLPISPFPFPTSQPLQSPSDPLLKAHPLTGPELHSRLILQSTADQVSDVWNGTGSNGSDGEKDASHLATSSTLHRMAIPARDFMVIRIPGHDLTDNEAIEMKRVKEEAQRVTNEWEQHGGLWIDEGTSRRWVGIDEPE